MFTLATEADVTRVLGALDAVTMTRVLAILPSVDELEQVVRISDEPVAARREPESPSAARIASVQAVLAQLGEDEVTGQARWRAGTTRRIGRVPGGAR